MLNVDVTKLELRMKNTAEEKVEGGRHAKVYVKLCVFVFSVSKGIIYA